MVKKLNPMDENTYLFDDIKDWINGRKYRRFFLTVVGTLVALAVIAWTVIKFG